MKRLTLLLSALTAALIASSSVINIDSGEILPDTTPYNVTAPTITKEYVDDGIIVTYTFENVWLDSIDFEMRNVFIPRFDGMTELLYTAGLPDLPHTMDTHLLSLNCSPSVSLIEYEYSEYFFEIAPAEPILFDCIDCEPSPRVAINLPAGFYPSEVVRLTDIDEAKGRLYVDVDITPIAYDHSTKTVRIPTKIKYKLLYNSTSGISTPVNAGQGERISVVGNALSVNAEKPTRLIVYDGLGRQILSSVVNGTATYRLDAGFYHVTFGSRTEKIKI